MKGNISSWKIKKAEGVYVWELCLFSFLFVEPRTSQPSDLRDGGPQEWVMQTYRDEKHEAEMHYCYYPWISAQFYVA